MTGAGTDPVLRASGCCGFGDSLFRLVRRGRAVGVCAEVLAPVIHQQQQPLEQVRAGVGGLDLVQHTVRQRGLDDLARGPSPRP